MAQAERLLCCSLRLNGSQPLAWAYRGLAVAGVLAGAPATARSTTRRTRPTRGQEPSADARHNAIQCVPVLHTVLLVDSTIATVLSPSLITTTHHNDRYMAWGLKQAPDDPEIIDMLIEQLKPLVQQQPQRRRQQRRRQPQQQFGDNNSDNGMDRRLYRYDEFLGQLIATLSDVNSTNAEFWCVRVNDMRKKIVPTILLVFCDTATIGPHASRDKHTHILSTHTHKHTLSTLEAHSKHTHACTYKRSRLFESKVHTQTHTKHTLSTH